MLHSSDDVVDLNVGGTYYTTTIQTLNSDPDSALAKLFNTNSTESSSSDTMRLNGERVFIDRDGPLFRFVLDYLRNGCRLVLPDVFLERNRLLAEAEYFRLPGLVRCLQKQVSPAKRSSFSRRSPSPSTLFPVTAPMDVGGGLSPNSYLHDRMMYGSLQQQSQFDAGCIIIGYRGTFAFGRDSGVADVKFRKLWRILVSGRVALCKEVFGDTLNESRDPDRGDCDRYSARFFLKHMFLEQAFDALLDAGFVMVGACGSGTNSVSDVKPGNDTEESRWNHYNEFVFARS